MAAIVMNTANGAVTEYDWAFQSITALRAASAAAGLVTLGGDTDAGAPITGEIRGGKPDSEKMLSVGNVYITIEGAGAGVLIVEGRNDSWEYQVDERASGIWRAKPGRGIRESRLGFGYRNVAGADFRLDRIDAEINVSTTRRV